MNKHVGAVLTGGALTLAVSASLVPSAFAASMPLKGYTNEPSGVVCQMPSEGEVKSSEQSGITSTSVVNTETKVLVGCGSMKSPVDDISSAKPTTINNDSTQVKVSVEGNVRS